MFKKIDKRILKVAPQKCLAMQIPCVLHTKMQHTITQESNKFHRKLTITLAGGSINRVG
jgi:hypothetical protein